MNRKRSWLSFVLDNRETFMISSLCSMVTAVVMMEFMIWQFGLYDRVGPFKAEKQAADGQRVTVLKPITDFADTGNRLFVDKRPGAGRPDWDMQLATRQAINLRTRLLSSFQERDASSEEFDAADLEFVATLKQIEDLLGQLEAHLRLEQEASAKESKDAISKDVGDSG